MGLKLLVQHKTVYGKALIYPVNETARVGAELLRKKTFSDSDLTHLERMGFEIEWVPQGESEPSPEGAQAREYSLPEDPEAELGILELCEKLESLSIRGK